MFDILCPCFSVRPEIFFKTVGKEKKWMNNESEKYDTNVHTEYFVLFIGQHLKKCLNFLKGSLK